MNAMKKCYINFLNEVQDTFPGIPRWYCHLLTIYSIPALWFYELLYFKVWRFVYVKYANDHPDQSRFMYLQAVFYLMVFKYSVALDFYHRHKKTYELPATD